MKMKYNKYLTLIVIIISLILLLVGFLIGNVFSDNYGNKCMNNPFIYGINEMNKLNNDKFACSCYSITGYKKGFYFNENEFILNP